MPPKESSTLSAPAPAKTGGAARFSFGGGAPKCKTCNKSVYENEKIVYDQVVYHQECFKCKKCTNRIPLVNVAMISGDLYCKPCFKKIFAEKGTYSSFGDKTTPKWTAEEAKKRGSVDGAGATSPPAAAATPASPTKPTPIAEEPEAKAAPAAEPAPAAAPEAAPVDASPAPEAAPEAAPAAEAAPAEAAPAAAPEAAPVDASPVADASPASPEAAAPAEEPAAAPAVEATVEVVA